MMIGLDKLPRPEQIKELAIEQATANLSGKACNHEMRDLSDEEIKRVFGNCVMATHIIFKVTAMRDNGMTLMEFLDYEEGSFSLSKYHPYSNFRQSVTKQLTIFQ